MATPRDTPESIVSRVLSERLERARRSVAEALEAFAAPIRLGPATPGTSPDDGDLEPVRAFLDATRPPATQKEILTALIDAAAGRAARTILFILRADTLNAWAVRSLPAEGGRVDPHAAHLTLPARGDHLPARATQAGASAAAGPEGPGFLITEHLGGPIPEHSVAVPIVARGRVVAVLYGDTGAGRAPSPEPALTILGRLAGLVLETLAASRRARALPVTGPVAGRLRVEVGTARPVAARAGEPESRRGSDSSPAATGVHDLWDEEEGLEAGSMPSAMITPPEDAEMQALLTDLDGMRHGVGDGGLDPDDQRLHADARRFASLLISEILLYNEEAVVQGRRHRDLGRRLAKEIDKSRQAYASRLPAHLRSAARYFEDELVRVLAEGDASALGSR